MHSRAEVYRAQIGNLELIVNMYNEMMDTLHSVERPLVDKVTDGCDEMRCDAVDSRIA